MKKVISEYKSDYLGLTDGDFKEISNFINDMKKYVDDTWSYYKVGMKFIGASNGYDDFEFEIVDVDVKNKILSCKDNSLGGIKVYKLYILPKIDDLYL